MAVNRNGKVKTRKGHSQSWNYYDKMPTELKRVLQNAPFRLQFQNIKKGIKLHGVKGYAKHLQKEIDLITKKSCLATYGKDHPQAK